MLTTQQTENTNILELTLDGGMSREEFDAAVSSFERIVAAFGKVRLIEIIRDIDAIEPFALWADLKFAPRHMKDFFMSPWSPISIGSNG